MHFFLFTESEMRERAYQQGKKTVHILTPPQQQHQKMMSLSIVATPKGLYFIINVRLALNVQQALSLSFVEFYISGSIEMKFGYTKTILVVICYK